MSNPKPHESFASALWALTFVTELAAMRYECQSQGTGQFWSASPFADAIMPPSVAHQPFEPQACRCCPPAPELPVSRQATRLCRKLLIPFDPLALSLQPSPLSFKLGQESTVDSSKGIEGEFGNRHPSTATGAISLRIRTATGQHRAESRSFVLTEILCAAPNVSVEPCIASGLDRDGCAQGASS